MAILKEGINGPLSGKVGSIVGYQLNGQNIIRSLPRRVKRKATAQMLSARQRMAAVSQFLAPIKPVIAFGYKHVSPPGSRIGPFQAAQSYHLKYAIDYDQENTPYVNPEKALVFRGELTPPVQVEAIRHEQGIRLTWNDATCEEKDAVLLVLAYVPEKNFVLFEEGGVKAGRGSFDFQIKETILTTLDTIHIYAGFYDIFRDQLSDSVYAGCV